MNGSIKGLHLSQGHYFEESKIHLYCKSDFFFFNSAGTKSFLWWLSMFSCVGVHTLHQECPLRVTNDTTSLQRAHDSTQGSHRGCEGLQGLTSSQRDFPRYLAQKMENTLVKHGTPWVSRNQTVFARWDQIQQLRKGQSTHAGTAVESENLTHTAWGTHQPQQPPASFLNLLTLRILEHHYEKCLQAWAHSAARSSVGASHRAFIMLTTYVAIRSVKHRHVYL